MKLLNTIRYWFDPRVKAAYLDHYGAKKRTKGWLEPRHYPKAKYNEISIQADWFLYSPYDSYLERLRTVLRHINYDLKDLDWNWPDGIPR